ncbi:neurofilament protein [Holdemanella porci]|jgi:chemotaxis protein histidine kinase CheA|uniref:neurofilament protein n=1 Tax=Holdemanella TaxID=1573535 RepID=UPI001D139FA9|nr:neurofilament protein [Holdemanella porci]MCC3360247.1 neurofilament protein [Holdemanella porci]
MPTKTTKKVTNKKVVDKKEEVKAVKPVEEKKVETKPVAEKKAPAKKVASEKKTPAKKEEAKPAEEKKAPAKKVAAEKKAPAKKEEAKLAEKKKVTAKKATAEKKAPAKKEEAKPVEKKKVTAKKATAEKKAPAKKEEAKPAEEKKATVEKKTPAKKAAAKPSTTKKASTKKTTTKKTTTKKATTKKMTKEEQYAKLSLDTCLDLAKAMSMDVTRDSIIQQLILNPDVKSVSENLVNKYQLTGKFNFEEDGYDEGLVEVLVSKVFETADIKPQKPEDLQADVTHALNYKFTDVVADGEEYKDQFDTMRKVLMIAQHKDIHDSKKLEEEVGVDVEKFVEEFMDLAYSVLKTWKYEDVDYYEHFIFAVLSQLEDLHNKYSNRIMMDVADLYILHGDYGLGDADYAYILRENQIKDYIYYRYASIYEGVDKDKAKQIANQALQFVDDRFTYYPNIIAVLEG